MASTTPAKKSGKYVLRNVTGDNLGNEALHAALAGPTSNPGETESRGTTLGAAPGSAAAFQAVPARLDPKDASDYVIGQSYEVPLGWIKDNPFNARVYYSSEDVDGMAVTLRENGQQVHAQGYVDGAHVILIDGQKRHKGAAAGGLPTLKVDIVARPENVRQEYLRSRLINLNRSSQTVLDDAIRFRELLDGNHFENQTELGAAVGYDQTQVSRILSINFIPERVRRRMKDQPATTAFKVATALARIFTDETHRQDPVAAERIADDIIDEIVRKELSAKEVENLVTSKLTGPRTRARNTVEHYKFGGKQAIVKLNESAGKLDFTISGLSVEKFADLKTKLQKLFAEQPS